MLVREDNDPCESIVVLHKQGKHWYIGTNYQYGLYILRLILINVYKSYTCYCPYLYQTCTKPVPSCTDLTVGVFIYVCRPVDNFFANLWITLMAPMPVDNSVF
jgi:hypothetical protein